jgi:hypothetical protein
MRRADPGELTQRAVPVMTAKLTEEELHSWVPVNFEEIDDPLAVPEPSKAALVALDSGAYVVLYYGKESNQLTVEIPERTSDSSAVVASFLSEVPLPVSRVLWHRADTDLPLHSASESVAHVTKQGK